jgi:hypothetical protein
VKSQQCREGATVAAGRKEISLKCEEQPIAIMPTINVDSASALHLQDIADVLAKSRKVVIITGAGISTNCGIPVS